ncbi:MAG: hypothetical protein E4G90_01465 [Gemmatimonadales bacterium]|nr:MAG: hypothetical protein E4G90_01465 [Gemmatimonadales bacterium]
MALLTKRTKVAQLDCCPQLEPAGNCDSLDITYRLPFRPIVGQQRRVVPVAVVLHFRLTRCSGELGLGDLAYTTTLLPGEKVWLRTSDRHTRFSYDTETNLAYRHEATSEESFFMAGMANAVSDVSSVEAGAASSRFSESSTSYGGGASLDLFFFEIGGGASGSSYNASSATSYLRSASRHAEASSRHVEVGVRAASATSVGEVERRTHAEGESESHFEASSRVFQNPNHCHAITYLFYKINKLQKVTFELVAIERRVNDPAAPTGAVLNPRLPTTKVSVLPKSVVATASNRLAVEQADRTSRAEQLNTLATASRSSFFTGRMLTAGSFATEQSFSVADHRAALAEVDKELAEEGLLDAKTGEVSERVKARVRWERTFALPTAGIIVKGCLDECNTCEPTLKEEIRLGLERKKLENQMLEKQIELLEQSQEYRCCPAGEEEDNGD